MKENEEKKTEAPKKRYFFEVAITRYRDCPVFAKSLEEAREIAEQWAEYEYGGWDYKVDTNPNGIRVATTKTAGRKRKSTR